MLNSDVKAGLLACIVLPPSCAPTLTSEASGGAEIPFVFNNIPNPRQETAVLALESTTNVTSPEQPVFVPNCLGAAVELRYVRQFGERQVVSSCQELRRATETRLNVVGGSALGGGLILGGFLT